MLYKVTVPVEGSLLLEEGAWGCGYSSGASDLSYAFAADRTGRVVSVSIQVKVPPEKAPSFRSTFGPGHGDSKLTVTIGGDKELYERIVLELRKLECNLSFALRGDALRRFNYSQMKIGFVPESDEDRALLGVTAYSVSQGYPDRAVRISGETFGRAVEIGRQTEKYDVHKAFLHDGINYFRSLQYVAAFYQFFFILEDFYAPGHSGRQAVIDAFARSDEMTKILKNALRQFTKSGDRHSEALGRLMKGETCPITVNGLREFLVKIRGHLHHYSSASPKPKGSPFNQSEFESVALLAMLLARHALELRIRATA